MRIIDKVVLANSFSEALNISLNEINKYPDELVGRYTAELIVDNISYAICIDSCKAKLVETNPSNDITVVTSEKIFLDILKGKYSPVKALLLSKVKIKGNKSVIKLIQNILTKKR